MSQWDSETRQDKGRQKRVSGDTRKHVCGRAGPGLRARAEWMRAREGREKRKERRESNCVWSVRRCVPSIAAMARVERAMLCPRPRGRCHAHTNVHLGSRRSIALLGLLVHVWDFDPEGWLL